MVEWHRHSIKQWGPEFGTLDTLSILPTKAFRPTRAYLQDHGLKAVIPYGSLGLGVNTNSISQGSGLPSTARASFEIIRWRFASEAALISPSPAIWR